MISGHEKKGFTAMDGNNEEREMPGRDMRNNGFRMLKGTLLLLLTVFALWPYTLMDGSARGRLRRYRASAFHMARFRCELKSQKEKDGKKRMLIPA